ncbi:MAG: homocysteine S-methyltransferase family protein [Pseudomonadales bacterium]|nr:homocysteine S-methyltransferase family protein [Pseudomonadales bacterium]
MILDDKLNSGETLLLDGAVGAEVERFGGKMDSAAWCGLATETHPDVVRHVHAEYLRAGSDIVTANTFANCRHVLDSVGKGDDASDITKRAVELVCEAIDEVSPDRPIAVAGSMSNTMAWIPGTFSTDETYVPSPNQQSANYREQAEALAEAGADLIVLEMMSDVDNASRLAEAASTVGLPVWIGMSCSLFPDGSAAAWHMNLEEPPEKLAETHEDHGPRPFEPVVHAMQSFNPQVMGIMHSRMAAVGVGIEMVRKTWSGPMMVYPESLYEHAEKPDVFANHLLEFRDGGAQILGGCCGTRIDHIQSLAKALGR